MKSQTKPSKMIIAGKLIWEECGHCKALVPEWKKMKNSIRSHSKKNPGMVYKFVEIKSGDKEQDHINIINNKYLQNSEEKLMVQGGYPTIFKISGGSLSYFNGASRNAEELQKFYLENIQGGNQSEEFKQLEKNIEKVTSKIDDVSLTPSKPSSIPQTTGFMDKIRSFFGGKKTNKRRTNKHKKTQKHNKQT